MKRSPKKMRTAGMLGLYLEFYMLKLKQLVMRPFRGMPTVDFNNVYDHTIL